MTISEIISVVVAGALVITGIFFFTSDASARRSITVDLMANGEDSTTISEGESVILTWETTSRPSKCVASGGWSGTKDTAGGSESVGPLFEDTEFSIECKKGPQRGSDTVLVTVEPGDPGEDGATLLFSEPCNAFEGDCTEHHLSVTCQNIPDRKVSVWEFGPDTPTPNGAIILATGGQGRGLYGKDNVEKRATRDAVLEAGFEAFAIGWDEPTGWFDYGSGYGDSACGFAHVTQWIHDYAADNSTAMCAAGNSGGAFQISYGLELGTAGDILDMVVPSSGPNFPDVEAYCFDPDYPFAQGGGRGPTDLIMGWDGNGDYCRNRTGPDWAHEEADRTSLFSDLEIRTLDYPNTKVNLVYSENDYAGQRGQSFFEVVSSEVVFHELPGDVHNLDQDPVGAALIRDLLVTECVDNSS